MMLEQVVKAVMRKLLAVDYPHLGHPAAMHAVVTRAELTGDHYEYNLRIIDKAGQVDGHYPELPGVKSRLHVEVGATVVILLPYGELNPVIVSEVVP